VLCYSFSVTSLTVHVYVHKAHSTVVLWKMDDLFKFCCMYSRTGTIDYFSLGVIMGRLCVLDQFDSNACFGSDGNWSILSSHLCGLFYSKFSSFPYIRSSIFPVHTLANQQTSLGGCKLVTWCANSEFLGHYCPVVTDTGYVLRRQLNQYCSIVSCGIVHQCESTDYKTKLSSINVELPKH
jgi:hypothetical protein